MRVLGIETSCDETSVAIFDAQYGLLGHEIYSQTSLHAPFGGVVPELASRDHIRKTLPLIKTVLKQAEIEINTLSGIAYTKGPGLAGALLIGAMLGRTLGFAWNLPTIGVHHLEGHLLAPFLDTHPPEFPFLALLVSGGHTLLAAVSGIGQYKIMGETLDDAVGEAFDKTARLLGLPYPGGALLANLAEKGSAHRFHFPRPMVNRPGLDFSFSGLKTYALRTITEYGSKAQSKADIALAFQDAVVDTLTIKCKRALKVSKFKRLVVTGGVSANLALRKAFKAMCADLDIAVYFPGLEFCTDNGAMIAYAGCQRLLMGERDDLSVAIKPRWPLESLQSL